MGTHILNLQLQLRLGSLVRSLEGKVLQEVRGAVRLVGLCAGAGIDVDADGARGGMGLVLGRDGQAIAQLEGGKNRQHRSQSSHCRTGNTHRCRLRPVRQDNRGRISALLDGLQGRATAQGLVQVEGEPTRGHGCRQWGGVGEGDGGSKQEARATLKEFGVLRSGSIRQSKCSANHMTCFSHRADSVPA